VTFDLFLFRQDRGSAMAMTETAPEAAPKSPRKALLLGGVLALLMGGGGFYATWSGLLAGGGSEPAGGHVAEMPDIAFVPVAPLIVSIGPGGGERHLRFTSQIEVEAAEAEAVTQLMPRIMDVMNSYLRALDSASLEDPAGLVRMRAQMLRRIQMVTGEGRVRDLLITEFVLN
jgi:flagellar FliL protein